MYPISLREIGYIEKVWGAAPPVVCQQVRFALGDRSRSHPCHATAVVGPSGTAKCHAARERAAERGTRMESHDLHDGSIHPDEKHPHDRHASGPTDLSDFPLPDADLSDTKHELPAYRYKAQVDA